MDTGQAEAIPRTVEVLLATYNGAHYLQQQIDSVLAQQGIGLRILASDDGSHDKTPAILAACAQAHPNRFRILPTTAPTGSAKQNFHRLLLASRADYVAFCDQDDVWLPHKLQVTLARMQQLEATHGNTTPLLVSTDLRIVDDSLNVVVDSLWQQNGLSNAERPPLGMLLSENTVTGCTALLNRALVDRMSQLPEAALMHDHWAALVAAGTGAIAGIPEPTVLYRQHGNNVVGAIEDRSILQKLQRLLSRKAVDARAAQYRKDRAQAEALLQLNGPAMQPQSRRTVEAFIALDGMGRSERLRTVQRHNLWRSGMQRKLTAIADMLRP